MPMSSICARLARMFFSLSGMPLGVPVLPLEKSSVASSSGFRLAHHQFFSTPAGNIFDRIIVHAICGFRALRISFTSQKLAASAGQGKSFSRSRAAAALRTTRTLAIFIHAAAALPPAAKFTFTLLLPASATARLAIHPPAPGGSTIPMRASGSFLSSCASTTAAAIKVCAFSSLRFSPRRSTRATRAGFCSNASSAKAPRLVSAAPDIQNLFHQFFQVRYVLAGLHALVAGTAHFFAGGIHDDNCGEAFHVILLGQARIHFL